MNNVERIIYENQNVKTVCFNTKEQSLIEDGIENIEPDLIKRIQSEVFRLGVEPGIFSFEYDDNKSIYEVSGDNNTNRAITQVKISDITKRNRLKRKII